MLKIDVTPAREEGMIRLNTQRVPGVGSHLQTFEGRNMNVFKLCFVLGLSATLALSQARAADDEEVVPPPSDAKPAKPAKEFVSFGSLKAPAVDAARAQALEWLKGAGK